MAVRESAASPQVKRALVAAGGASGWVPRRGVEGGVTSARSNLNADIHLLDNAASRAGHLLESVAGDEAAVHARRDEIVAALAKTAKPYIGDVEAMTYLELLARFTERCATGRFGRYDDGAWGHPSWRARALALFERFAARLSDAESGPIAFSLSLDDPAAALQRVRARAPVGRDDVAAPRRRPVLPRGLRPPGQARAVRARARRRSPALVHGRRALAGAGRPPRRRQVFVIPGPEAVAGITRADEPVADLLARFEAAAIARAGAAVPRERLAAPGPAPAPLSDHASGSGPIAALCAAQCVVGEDGRVRPNPLWRLVAPGDTISAHEGTIVLRPSSATVESVTLARRRRRRHRHVDTATGEPLVLRSRSLRPRVRRPRLRRRRRHTRSPRSAAMRRAAAFAAARARRGPRPPRVDDPLRGIVTPWTCPPDAAARVPRGDRRRARRCAGRPRAHARLAGADGAARVPGARGAAVGARPRVARDHARPGVAAACRARRGRRPPGSSSSTTPPARRRACAATRG